MTRRVAQAGQYLNVVAPLVMLPNPVPVGVTEVDDIIPPAGHIWEMVLMRYLAPIPPGATVGFHDLAIWDSNIYKVVGATYIHNIPLEYVNGVWIPPVNSIDNTFLNPDNFPKVDMVASTLKPLHFRYTNNTDAIQTSVRQLWLAYKDFKI